MQVLFPASAVIWVAFVCDLLAYELVNFAGGVVMHRRS
jgi:hypothetical protein